MPFPSPPPPSGPRRRFLHAHVRKFPRTPIPHPAPRPVPARVVGCCPSHCCAASPLCGAVSTFSAVSRPQLPVNVAECSVAAAKRRKKSQRTPETALQCRRAASQRRHDCASLAVRPPVRPSLHCFWHSFRCFGLWGGVERRRRGVGADGAAACTEHTLPTPMTRHCCQRVTVRLSVCVCLSVSLSTPVASLASVKTTVFVRKASLLCVVCNAVVVWVWFCWHLSKPTAAVETVTPASSVLLLPLPLFAVLIGDAVVAVVAVCVVPIPFCSPPQMCTRSSALW